MAYHDGNGCVWRRSETGRFDKFLVIAEKERIPTSQAFDSLQKLCEDLLDPLNKKMKEKFGSEHLILTPE